MSVPWLQFLIGASMAIGLMLPLSAEAENGSSRVTLNQQDPALKAGDPFIKVRKSIVASGWKPVRMHQSDGYQYSGTETELANHGFLEVDSCSTDSGSLCTFYYRKAAECLRLDTVGEQLKDIQVTYWTHECPPEKSWYALP